MAADSVVRSAKKAIAREKEKSIKKTHGAVPEGRDGGEKGRALGKRTEERKEKHSQQRGRTTHGNMQRALHFTKKETAQREVRGKRQTRRRQENRKMQSSIKPEAEVDMGDKK